MCKDFFCHACQRHRPLEEKRDRPTGKRPICMGCLEALIARTKPVTTTRTTSEGKTVTRMVKPETTRKSRITTGNARREEHAKWVLDWVSGRFATA